MSASARRSSRSVGWPARAAYVSRFRVPDLLPGAPERARAVFVGESPHRDEVASDVTEERTPFRGMAGREWWSAVGRLSGREIPVKPMPPRAVLEPLCQELGIGLINAVQYPLDPGIVRHTGAEADPATALGFAKATGPTSYKRVFKEPANSNPVVQAIEDLRARLAPFVEAGVPVVCLGNDSRWFVDQALAENAEALARVQVMPHPSSWWRNANNRTRAMGVLGRVLSVDR